MRPSVYVLLLCLAWFGSAWKDHFGVEREIYIVEESGKTLLLLHDNLLHEAPDNVTIEALGAKMPNGSLDLSKLKRGAPLSTLRMTVNTPDEVIRIMVAKSLYIAPPVGWLSVQELGAMINPSLVHWENQTIICWKDGIEGHIQLKVFGPSAPSSSPIVFHGNNTCSTNADHLPWHFNGEDARIVPLPDGRLHFIFTSHHEWNYRMYSSRARIDPSTRLVSFERQEWFTVMDHGYMPKSWGQHQKNWCPFLLAGTGRMMFVQSFNPLHVMELVEDGRPASICEGLGGCGMPSNCSQAAVNASAVPWRAYSRTVSLAQPMDLKGWEYGAPRGGTPAILLPGSDLYFALFHTRYHIPGNVIESYLMGAVTWRQDVAGTFQLHSISRAPILNASMYDGPWTPNRHGPPRIDYVVFPLGILLDESDPDRLTVSIGRQDSYGTVFTVSLRSLLAGMVLLN